MGKTLRQSEGALLKKITVANYRQDPYYAQIVKAVEGLLRENGFVAPLELFIRMDLLSPESVEDWRRGRIAYLERVIRCNLAKASRILRILRMHAHDLAGVYCELREQACKQIFVRELEALRRITHVGYYEAMAARPRVLTKACWARDCCEST